MYGTTLHDVDYAANFDVVYGAVAKEIRQQTEFCYYEIDANN